MKYVISKVDDEPCVICISKCNFCPFFVLEKSEFGCFCRNTKDNIQKYLQNVNSVIYVGSMRYTSVDVKRPDWCELDELMVGNDLNDTLYYKTPLDVIISEKVDPLFDLPFLFDIFLKHTNGKIVKDKKKIELEKISKIEIENKDVCSCCGEKKENIDRNKNMGMCDDCHKMVMEHNDEETIRFIYMNNFRLKRKSSFSSSKFKRITDNDNFYHKNIV